MCEIHVAWSADKITLYVEGGEEPLAVEQPFGNEEVANDDDVHEAPQNGDDMHEVGQNDDDVHEMHEGGNVDAEGGGGQDFDWLEEGFEGPDFDDDVFGNVDNGPSTHDGVSVNAAAPHRPSKGDDGPSTHEDLLVYAAPHRTTAANNDPPLEEGEWIDPPFKDDMESLAQGSKSTKIKQIATPQTRSQPPSTRSQPAYRAFGQTASQLTPNNRSEAATEPLARSRANWFSSSSQPSFHTPKET
nr:hypothetical protein CFP56_51095 [Quercus suber]